MSEYVVELRQELQGHRGIVWSVDWCPTSSLLASCGADKTIRLWTLLGENFVSAGILDELHTKTVRCVRWSPDGKTLASTGFDGLAALWQCVDGKEFECVASLEGPENELKSIAWSLCDSLIATCSRDKTVWIWSADDDGEYECMSVLHGHSQDVKCVIWHPTQRMLMSASYDDTIKVWTEDEDDWHCSATLKAHTSTVWSLAFTDAEGYCMISTGNDNEIYVWKNLKHNQAPSQSDWQVVSHLNVGQSRSIYSVACSVEGLLATGAGDNSIALIGKARNERETDASKYELKTLTRDAHAGDVNCVCWKPKSNDTLCSAGDDKVIRVWNVSLRT